jgi:hypothetical protein
MKTWRIETPYGTMTGDGVAPLHVVKGLREDHIPVKVTLNEGTPRAASFKWRWPWSPSSPYAATSD